jgi:hypothetical protein
VRAATESLRHTVIRQIDPDPGRPLRGRPGFGSVCRSDRCLFDSDRLGVDRFAVAPESIFVAQTPLALFLKIGIL